ncbi:UbiA prenyltransferase family [Xylaria intraflava]|nr:UbiA prenyltransferase family [Xylaria intraflava]
MSLQQAPRFLAFHAYSLWLFTFSDLKTIVFPQTMFGLLSAFASARSGAKVLGSQELLGVLQRAPVVLFWVWITLLPFEINNQRTPKDIEEDLLNKPWRTLPSKRWTPRQATYVMIFFYLVGAIVSWNIGGFRFNMSLLLLGVWYNNMGGSDVNALIRNLINALGYSSFAAGALEVALNKPLRFDWALAKRIGERPSLETWIVVLLAIILTTVHTQDMQDQKGDALRDRRSLPLQIGDGPCRWVIAICMAFWGLFCPLLWQCGWVGHIVSIPLAHTVALRSLSLRSVEADKTTFRIWNLWIVCLYTLPLI